MPRKVRQIKADAKRAGFLLKPGRGKGSHTVWAHAEFPSITLTISGHDGDDAHYYQEDRLQEAMEKVAKERTKQRETE